MFAGYGGSGGYHYYDRDDSEKEDTKGIKQAQAKEQKLDSALLSCLQTVHSCMQIAIGEPLTSDCLAISSHLLITSS